MNLWLLTLAALGGVVTWFAIGPALRRLPEPSDAPVDKVPYASLSTVRFRALTACCVTAALAISALCTGWPIVLAWLSLGSVGVALAAIDARTTYLPGAFMHVGWALAALAMPVLLLVEGWEPVLSAVAGAAVLGGLFWALWRVTGGLGFGDVKLALLVGGTAGTMGLTWLLTAALVGSLVGGVWGLLATRGHPHRSQPFPYGPSLVLGPYLTLLLQSLAAATGIT